MEFIKHHYEKLILMVMLLVFIFTMVHVIMIIRNTGEIKDSDLQIPRKAPDYVQQDPKSSGFQIAKLWVSSALNWQASQARDAQHNANHYSDLCVFPDVAFCPGENAKGEKCGKLIPLFYFKDGNRCPECGFELRTPPERPKGRRNVVTADDSDGDGISNADENKYGLNSQDPTDAQADLDGDGFSNIYELEQGTNPKVARNHPPLWHRLRFVDIRRVELPVKFMALTAEGDDPSRWDIQLNVLRTNRRTGVSEWKTDLKRLNEEVRIERADYTIVKIERKLRVIENAQGADGKPGQNEQTKALDESVIYLVENVTDGSGREPDRLEMHVGKAAYSSDQRPIFVDTGSSDNKQFTVRRGEHFTMGDRQTTGIAEYVLKAYDGKSFTAELEAYRPKAKPDDPPIVITREGKIPDESRVIFRESESAGEVRPEAGAPAENRRLRVNR